MCFDIVVAREHALHGHLDHALRMLLEHHPERRFLEAADEARVAEVDLLLELRAGDLDEDALTTITKSPMSR